MRYARRMALPVCKLPVGKINLEYARTLTRPGLKRQLQNAERAAKYTLQNQRFHNFYESLNNVAPEVITCL